MGLLCFGDWCRVVNGSLVGHGIDRKGFGQSVALRTLGYSLGSCSLGSYFLGSYSVGSCSLGGIESETAAG